MLYPKIFVQLEKVRWNMADDVPWDSFDASRLSDEQATTIKMNAITEWSALPATEMFLRDNRHDSDFSAFMSVWFYEEQKHSLVLMEYLRKFRPDLLPTEAELHAVRFDFDPAPYLELPAFYQAKRDRFCAGLARSRFRLLPSNGTYFVLADYSAISDATEEVFARELIEKHGVASIPVSAFYREPVDNHVVRFCFAKREATLAEAAERLMKV